LIRHWFGVPSAAIAVLLGISLSACAGSAGGAAVPPASSTQQTQKASPDIFRPLFPILVSESFSPTSFTGGGTTHLTITFASSVNDGSLYLTPMSFSEKLPANIYVVGGESAAIANTCGGQTSVGANQASFALNYATVDPAAASCYVTFIVSGYAPGTYENLIPANAATSPYSTTSNAATAYVTILPPHVIKP
jgi:hypothetical protein